MNDSLRRTARTAIQTAIGLAPMVPFIIDALGIPATLPLAAAVIAVAAAIARLMAIPGIDERLPSWLRRGSLAPAPALVAPALVDLETVPAPKPAPVRHRRRKTDDA